MYAVNEMSKKNGYFNMSVETGGNLGESYAGGLVSEVVWLT